MINIKTKLLISLFLLLLFANICLGYIIKNTNIECIVNPDNTINETITLLVYNDKNENLSSITFTIPQNVKNLTISSSNGISGYTALYNEGVTTVTIEFNKPIPPKKSANVTFKFLVTDAVWTKNNINQLIMNFPISSKNATIKVILPPGAVISSYQGNLFVTPSGYKITTDGKHQIIIWNLHLNKEITFTIAIKYTFVKFPNQNIIESGNNSFNNIFIFLTLGLLILGGLFIREKISKKKILEDYEKIINNLSKMLKKKDDEISYLKGNIKELEEKLDKTYKNLLNKDEIINILNEKISEYNSKLEKLINENKKYKEKIDSLNKYIQKLESENKKLKEKVEELNKVVEEYQNLKKGVLWDFLTDEEKIVIDLIKKYGNITQKELVEITGMSKPKVSRIVSELEDRKIIKKEKIGRINKLTLTEESKKLL